MAERKEVVPGFTRSELDSWKADARAASKEFQDGYEAGMDEVADFFSGDGDNSSNGNGDKGSGSGESSSRSTPRISFSSDSQKIIVVAMTVTVIVALIENTHQPKGQKGVPASNIIVGGFVSGALLLGMSYFLPEFASGFAIVAMISTVLERGKPFWDIIGSLTGTPIPAVSKGGSPNSAVKPSSGTPSTSTGTPQGTLV